MKHPFVRSLRILLLLLVIMSLALAACGDDDKDKDKEEEEAPPETVTLGLSLSTEANPFFVEIASGAQAEAETLGVEVVLMYAADDIDTQIQQIQEMIDQPVSALLINPVDSAGIVPSIEAANAAGIPVFTIDRGAEGGEIVAHVASDNVAGGRMAGDALAKGIGESGMVVELTGIEGASAAIDRGAGFNEAISAYENIEVIAQETANFNREEGQTVFAQILADNPEISGVFAHNDEMILGAIAAAEEAGREGIVFVGFDAVPDATAAVDAGTLYATIGQQPEEMGRLGVKTAVDHLNGTAVESFIPVNLALIGGR